MSKRKCHEMGRLGKGKSYEKNLEIHHLRDPYPSKNPINYYVSIVIEEKAYNFPFPIQRCMWSIKYNKVVQPTSLIDRNVLLPFPSVHVDTFQFVYYYSRIFIYTLESSFVTMYYIVM